MKIEHRTHLIKLNFAKHVGLMVAGITAQSILFKVSGMHPYGVLIMSFVTGLLVHRAAHKRWPLWLSEVEIQITREEAFELDEDDLLELVRARTTKKF